MNRFILAVLSGFILSTSSIAQTVYLESNDPRRQLADRLNTLYGSTGDSVFTHSNQISYWELANQIRAQKQDVYLAKLTNIDNYDVSKYLGDISEFNLLPSDPYNPAPSNVGWYGFYQNTGYLMEKAGNFHWMIQPEFQLMGIYGRRDKWLQTGRLGLSTRGIIGSRWGFAANVNYNTLSAPSFYNNYIIEQKAMPGNGNFENSEWLSDISSNSYEYLNYEGQLNFDIIQHHLTASVGRGRFFIGDGVRSLVLSDFGAPMPYLSFRTQFWKFQYQNFFFKATSQHPDLSYNLPGVQGNKYIAMHFLSTNVFPWLNIGLYETTISSRDGGPEIGYFNPVVFYRSIERSYGSPDKMAIGITAKAVIGSTAQLYGQFFLNEFTAKEFFANKGYIHNKWGAQLGGKYYNMFKVSNLDLQVEANVVRPYAYQHRTNSNFSHHNMAIAHPLGAGFKELIGQISYRPMNRLTLFAKGVYIEQGLDAADSINMGSNILKDIRTFPNRYGVGMIHGTPSKTLIAQFNASYEFGRNLYIDAGFTYRKQATSIEKYVDDQCYGYLGVRFGLNRQDLFQF